MFSELLYQMTVCGHNIKIRAFRATVECAVSRSRNLDPNNAADIYSLWGLCKLAVQGPKCALDRPTLVCMRTLQRQMTSYDIGAYTLLAMQLTTGDRYQLVADLAFWQGSGPI